MINHYGTKDKIKFLTPDNLYEQLKKFTNGMSVTKGSFELYIENCMVEDVEWNHMDQMHRPTIHNTYEKGIRIATGHNFALSLTQWGRWPLLIPVTDIYIDKGLFYQSLSIAGIIFIHSIISLEQCGTGVKLKDEWYIASRGVFKFLHGLLNRKLYKLNKRLQEEDEPVRQGRLLLRQKGYQFNTDIPNYYNSNVKKLNTIYPRIIENAQIDLHCITESPKQVLIGGIEFIAKKESNSYLIWPAACPHEGGPLLSGKVCGKQITCPWHGLRFSAAELSETTPLIIKHGFEYYLEENHIHIKSNQSYIDMLKTKIVEELAYE